MSTKRIMIITVIGITIIAAALSVILLISYLNREVVEVALPDTPVATEPTAGNGTDALGRVEVNRDTVQAVVSSFARPDSYSRDVWIESYWESGQAVYNIKVSVADGMTSLLAVPQIGAEKRIIVTPDALYIWYKGDRQPFIGGAGSAGDDSREADEWQMMITYEDILELNKYDIIDAGYTQYDGADCVFAVYLSPMLGNTTTYFVSLGLGLVIAADEHDKAGTLIYSMRAGQCAIGEVDPEAFILPDGSDLRQK